MLECSTRIGSGECVRYGVRWKVGMEEKEWGRDSVIAAPRWLVFNS